MFMAPFFTIFQNEHTKLMSAHCIHTIEQYYNVTVEGILTCVGAIASKYGTVHSRFFVCEIDKWKMMTKDQLQSYGMAHFVLTFDENVAVEEESWEMILKWVQCIFDGEKNEQLNTLVGELIPSKGKGILVSSSGPAGDDTKANTEYQFKYIVDESRNMGLFEVIKPFTDKPYCAVIRNFSVRGFLPFFTALYVSSSWGVASHDHLFLKKIWDHLEMGKEHGEFDLERRLKEDIAKCSADNPGGAEAEPEVYRMSIKELLGMWGCRAMNAGFVKSGSSNQKVIEECLR